jgi:salicylate synthetase
MIVSTSVSALPGSPDPVSLVRALAARGLVREYLIYRDHRDGGGRVRIALNRLAEVTVSRERISLWAAEGDERLEVPAQDPFKQVEALLGRRRGTDWTAYGYLGFDLAGFYYPYKKAIPHPLLCLLVPETEIFIEGGTTRVISCRPVDSLLDVIAGACGARQELAATSQPTLAANDREEYLARARALISWIRDGQLDKAILSRQVELKGRLDPLATYAAAGSVNDAARSFCFDFGAVSGVGFSPELFLEATAAGQVVTNPLAGTRPRGATAEEDARIRKELFTDSKEVKEHAMSIRLAQEEMLSVCTPESVRVFEFMAVKRFRCVQHLSSRVGGRLAEGRTTWDAAKVLFPGITVSGVDKGAALSAIDRLEDRPRGVYGGAVGWIDSQGAADLSIGIRSVYGYEQSTVLNAGAGIVAESQPEREYVESVNKMNTMFHQVVLAEV